MYYTSFYVLQHHIILADRHDTYLTYIISFYWLIMMGNNLLIPNHAEFRIENSIIVTHAHVIDT